MSPTNIREKIREILNIISTSRSWSPDMNPYDIATNELVSLFEENQTKEESISPLRQKDITECKCCRGDIKIRNPKGFCDHLYYPENCNGKCKIDCHATCRTQGFIEPYLHDHLPEVKEKDWVKEFEKFYMDKKHWSKDIPSHLYLA